MINIQDVVLAAVPAIAAITLHETAHGYAAWALGDQTARRLGRLSLNPIRHVDRVGTLLVPGALILSQLVAFGRIDFMFGWAKPVPVDASRFRDPRRGMALVAAAGPAANFVLAWLAVLALRFTAFGTLGERFLSYFILSNLVLGLFNLLPIPPLDGGRVVVGLLPLPLALAWARVERAGLVIVLLVVFVLPRLSAEFGTRFDPVGAALNEVIPRAMSLVLWLGGQHG